MKIKYDKYIWKFVGIPKVNEDDSEEIEIFPEIVGPIVANVMEQCALYNAESSSELMKSAEYIEAKAQIHNNLVRTQENEMISIGAVSGLTSIPKEKLENFINNQNSEDFNTGELFVLDATLNKILKVNHD